MCVARAGAASNSQLHRNSKNADPADRVDKDMGREISVLNPDYAEIYASKTQLSASLSAWFWLGTTYLRQANSAGASGIAFTFFSLPVFICKYFVTRVYSVA
jgi:hypothetical protein